MLGTECTSANKQGSTRTSWLALRCNARSEPGQSSAHSDATHSGVFALARQLHHPCNPSSWIELLLLCAAPAYDLVKACTLICKVPVHCQHTTIGTRCADQSLILGIPLQLCDLPRALGNAWGLGHVGCSAPAAAESSKARQIEPRLN